MWRDEAATWQAAHRSPGEILHLLGQVDLVHGLYYAVMHVNFALFGDSLLTLRLPSVIAAAGACALTARLAARLCGRPAGTAAGLALAMVPAVQELAQEDRPYAGVLFFVVLSTTLLVHALQWPGRRRWAGYAAALLAAALLNWLALFTVAAHALTLVCVRPGRRQWSRWATAAGAAVAGALPLVLLSRKQAAQVAWIDPLGLPTVLAVTGTAAAAALCALLPVARTAADSRGEAREVTVGLGALAFPLYAVPQLGLLAVSAVKPLHVTRYVLYSYAGLALLVAALVVTLAARFRARSGGFVGVTACAALLVMLPQAADLRTADSRVDDVLAAARHVAEAGAGADGVLYIPAARRDTALVSPREFAGMRDLAMAQGPVDSGTLKGIEAAPGAVTEAIRDARRIVVVTDPGPPSLKSAGDRAKWQALAGEFVRLSDTVDRGRRVIVYARIAERDTGRGSVRDTERRTEPAPG
ncbi:glycosyltransferase family 39 protein [Streptomyces sp. TRM66268-LWL]|uniref:Glycosyltransferase family 39 protein n=2 Tax=Streptomyces polyasparticus TaxID=2767826 RepID=A0ABR7SMQ8_9ACTN|nr:glycosyltransferase family 39 protein [Streptomyces polyasparticus]